MVVYKYCTFESAANILLNGSILASHLDEYNDPFEACISWAKPQRSMSDKSDDVDGDDISFNELTSARKQLYKADRDKIRSTCFSRTNKDILLWSHYADNHRGVAICFWTSQMFSKADQKSAIFANIEYCGEKVRIFKDTKESTFLTKVNNSYFTKAKMWSYEEEVRLLVQYDEIIHAVAPFNSNKCFIKILPRSIKSVHYGCKTNFNGATIEQRVARELFRKYLQLRHESDLSTRNSKISEYQCEQSATLYALTTKRIDSNLPIATIDEVLLILESTNPSNYLHRLNSAIVAMENGGSNT